MKKIILLFACLLFMSPAIFSQTQSTDVRRGGTLPVSCLPLSRNVLFYKTGTGQGLYVCLTSNTWTPATALIGVAQTYTAAQTFNLINFDKTITATGQTGAKTINKQAFTVNFAASATSLVVTNSLITTSSISVCTVGTVDSTMKTVVAVVTANTLTLTSNAAATAETRVNCIVIN